MTTKGASGMVDVMEEKVLYLSHFERFEAGSGGGDQAWLTPIRKAAFARFAELGFPTIKHEEWRHTNVAPIAGTDFEPARADGLNITTRQIEPFLFDRDGYRLVFVNGRFAPELSSTHSPPDGLKVVNLAQAIVSEASLLERHLARYAGYDDQAFTALNTALMEDGVFIHVAKGEVVEQPIHVLYVSTAPDRPTVTHPRMLIVAEESAQATVVESFSGIDGGGYFTNPVTEIVAKENAVVDHTKIVREADDAYHVSSLRLHQHRSSSVTSHVVSLSGRLVRNDIETVLDGEGCECALYGLSIVSGTGHVDNHLIVDHAKPHCDSREFFKNVLDDRGRAVFSGRIVVREDAQKTDAKQTNMSLLLSEEAQVESQPQLEIFADDVKCTHGATIGQISDEAVFYLRARGLNEKAARSMLIHAFARESLDTLRVESLRDQLDELLFARLPGGKLLQGAR